MSDISRHNDEVIYVVAAITKPLQENRKIIEAFVDVTNPELSGNPTLSGWRHNCIVRGLRVSDKRNIPKLLASQPQFRVVSVTSK